MLNFGSITLSFCKKAGFRQFFTGTQGYYCAFPDLVELTLINKRHANFMPLVLISNRHLKRDCPEDTVKGCPKCLERYFDDDVISRIIEDGEIMKFTGVDYRRKIREKRGGKAA